MCLWQSFSVRLPHWSGYRLSLIGMNCAQTAPLPPVIEKTTRVKRKGVGIRSAAVERLLLAAGAPPPTVELANFQLNENGLPTVNGTVDVLVCCGSTTKLRYQSM